MSITVTVEELRKYQKDMEAWGISRANVVEHYIYKNSQTAIRTVYDDAFGRNTTPSQEFKKFVEDWDRQNPMPKIVPLV